MKLKANIWNKPGEPGKAEIKFMGKKLDIFQDLPQTTKNQIIRDHNITRTININKNLLKKHAPKEFELYTESIKALNQLPKPFIYEQLKIIKKNQNKLPQQTIKEEKIDKTKKTH